jgi:inner membrane protein
MQWIWKAAGLGAVGVVLTLVLGSVKGLVWERQNRQHQAQAEVAAATASQQRIDGPYLRRHCVEQWTVVETRELDNGSQRETRRRERADRVLRSQPAQLKWTGSLQPQLLERGLFQVRTYVATLDLEANWDGPQLQAWKSEELEGTVQCGAYELAIDVTDARGLRRVSLQLDGQALAARPGNGAGGRGLHAWMHEPPANWVLKGRIELLGTESLHLLPNAATFEARLDSPWPHPSFQGGFLPLHREVSEKGFSATWRLTELAAQVDDEKAQQAATLGVALIDPINPYSLSDRAVKYGFLFIALLLAAVLLAELLGRHRLHPVQYGFVGLGLALFFLLLLALSEHLAFALAYGLAAAACSALLGHYASSLFGHWRGGLAFGGGVAALLGVLYLVLNLEKAALLAGSLLCFALLALAMRLTRNVNWYAMGAPSGP